MDAHDARTKVILKQTILYCSYMEGSHKVTLNWFLPDGRANVHLVEVDPQVDPFFHRIYKVGDDMDCMLRGHSKTN